MRRHNNPEVKDTVALAERETDLSLPVQQKTGPSGGKSEGLETIGWGSGAEQVFPLNAYRSSGMTLSLLCLRSGYNTISNLGTLAIFQNPRPCPR